MGFFKNLSLHELQPQQFEELFHEPHPSRKPRFAVVAIYSNTATLYDYDKKKEIDSLDASYASTQEITELFQRCALLNAKHEDGLLYQEVVKEI